MITNEIGYPMLDQGLRSRVFGNLEVSPPDPGKLDEVKAEYERFGIPVPVSFSEGLYNGDVPVPNLLGDNIVDHFENVAKEAVGDYVDRGDRFAKAVLPGIPTREHILFQPGWTRYEQRPDGTFLTSRVPHPLEGVFTYDTETYVTGGAFPIIATCLSEAASYIWLARELIDPETPVSEWDSYNLVPIGTGNFVAGHNISYDRVRCQEAYSLESEDPENYYADTLSMNIAVSGLGGGQRWLHVLAGKDRELMTEEEKKKLRISTAWLDKGSMNSLVACYNYHVHLEREWQGLPTQKLGSGDKKARNIFVAAQDISEITEVIEESVEYAMRDAFYTAELFQSLWPKYREATPSYVGLAGHYYLAASRVPLTPDWEEWKEGAEAVWGAGNSKMTEMIVDLANDCYSKWKSLYDQDVQEALEDYEGPENKKPVFFKGLSEDGEWRQRSMAWVESDPWIRQLDWSIKSFGRGKFSHVPTWYRNFMGNDVSISAKTRVSHLLLKLKWNGSPVVWSPTEGWCY